MSGSAHEFAPWRPDDAGRFIESLSAHLVIQGFNVVTGFGLGVGPSVIAGALQEVLANPKRRSLNQLQAMPFPVDDGTTPARRAMYRRHREEMISKAGIAIFLFGNKRERGKIVAADGMREELAIVRSMGLHIVTAGATGWVAQEIAADFGATLATRSKKFNKAFAVANDPTAKVAEMVKAILTMVNEYREL
ncbi:hypothetical protein LP417_15570 [Polaromonas sp. P1-6]|nr:hypothetical protein LP417_15570 [Polaromonas sp. P1-6]